MSHRIAILFGSIILIFLFFSCASNNDAVSGIASRDDSSNVDIEGSVLPVIPKEEIINKNAIESDIIKNIQIGSAASLKTAAAKLRKADNSYTEKEADLMYICSTMLQILWPNEVVNWTIPEANHSSAYVAAIDSCRKGVYDFSAPKNDALICALPALLLITVPSVDNYFEEAEDSLKTAINLCNETVFARYLLGMLYNRQKKFFLAANVLKEAYELYQNNQILLQYLEALVSSGQTKIALDLAMKNMTTFETSSKILRYAAEAAFYEKQYDLADSLIVQVLQKEPDNSEYILFRVRILMARKEYIKVSSLLDMYARVEKSSKIYLLLRAQLQLEWNKNTVAASATLQEALNRYGNDTDVLLAGANLASSTGQKIGGFSATELAEKVLATDNINISALSILVDEYIKEKKWQKAYELNSKIMQSGNYNQKILVNHIDICLAINKMAEIEDVFQKLKNSPDLDKEILNETEIRILIAENKNDMALQKINLLINSVSGKSKSNLYYQKSRIAKNQEEKLSDLRLSLTAYPRNKDALLELYKYYVEKKDYRKAQYYLKQVVALSPDDEELLRLNSELDNLIEH